MTPATVSLSWAANPPNGVHFQPLVDARYRPVGQGSNASAVGPSGVSSYAPNSMTLFGPIPASQHALTNPTDGDSQELDLAPARRENAGIVPHHIAATYRKTTAVSTHNTVDIDRIRAGSDVRTTVSAT